MRRGRFRRERRVVDAVNGISFRVERGELLGYLGPNGAGKSTTIKMLTGILVPTAATSASPGSSRRGSGSSSPGGSARCSASASSSGGTCRCATRSSCCATSTACPPTATARTSRGFREVLELDPFLDTPVRQLSLGQRMRGELTAAMLHEPELLFLDEPTIGLDVVAKQRVRDFLVEINREDGVTVMLTTHDLGDIERLCNRLLVIDHGR